MFRRRIRIPARGNLVNDGTAEEPMEALHREAGLPTRIRRQQVGLIYPVALDIEAERATWQNFYALAPMDGPQGRALPAPPPYAPVEPTLVPPGTWTPAELG